MSSAWAWAALQWRVDSQRGSVGCVSCRQTMPPPPLHPSVSTTARPRTSLVLPLPLCPLPTTHRRSRVTSRSGRSCSAVRRAAAASQRCVHRQAQPPALAVDNDSTPAGTACWPHARCRMRRAAAGDTQCTSGPPQCDSADRFLPSPSSFSTSPTHRLPRPSTPLPLGSMTGRLSHCSTAAALLPLRHR